MILCKQYFEPKPNISVLRYIQGDPRTLIEDLMKSEALRLLTLDRYSPDTATCYASQGFYSPDSK